MSQPDIQNALENALHAITPTIDTVHGNESYDPIAGRPYQECYTMFGKPGNPTVGDGFYQEMGIFQVNLQYPQGVGTLESATRAALVREVFKRGATFISNGVTVQIDKTPEIPMGEIDGDRWKVVIRAPWHADIYS